MQFTAVAQVKKKVKSIVGILFLISFLSGCVVPGERGASSRNCRQAEDAVKQAQKQYEDVNQKFANGSKDQNTNSDLATAAKNLGDAEETAIRMCNTSQ